MKRRMLRAGSAFVLALLMALAVGCRASAPSPAPGPTPEAFLRQFNLAVQGDPVRFSVTVPKSWAVPMGAYPEGLYWGLVNEYSKDAGLDLTLLKGQTVEVWRYALTGGLTGQGANSQHRYPSDVILLVKANRVVGAWLLFNTITIGPSVKMRGLEAITGLTLEQWVAKEQYFTDPGPNSDLLTMGPVAMLNAFFTAIDQGDETRAAACLSPRAMVDTLTMNTGGRNLLYNPRFGTMNSLTKNITHAKLLSYRVMDPNERGGFLDATDHPASEEPAVGESTRLSFALNLEISWRNPAFSSPAGRETRFTSLEKYPNGWKLTGLGTGP